MSIERINAQIQEKGFHFEVTEEVIDRGFKKIITEDGKKVWFKGRKLGDDGLVCYFGDWKTGEKYKAEAFRPEILSTQSKKILKKFVKEVEEEKSQKAVEAKRQLDELWSKYKELEFQGNADYLELKNLTPSSGVLVRRGEEDAQKILVIPMFDESGEMLNIQQCFRKRKSFKTKAGTKGLFHVIDGQTDTVYIGEGYATCRAVNLATNKRVYVAFSVSNLEAVLKIAIKYHGNERVVLIADWDGGTFRKQGHNPGMFISQKLSLKYRVKVVAPVDVKEASLENTDFSDVWLKSGGIGEMKTLSFEDLRPHIFKIKKEPKPVPKPLLQNEVNPTLKIAEDVQAKDLGGDGQEEIPDYSYIIEPPSLNGWVPDYDEVTPEIMPDRNKKGGVKSTLNNFATLMAKVGATLRYNMIAKDQQWFIPGEIASSDNYKNVLTGRLLDLCARSNFPIGQIDSYLTYLCDKKQFNPVAAWIESKPWDGVSRLEKLYETVKVAGEDHDPKALAMKKVLIRKWMLMALAGAYKPEGIAAPGMLVFMGKQNIGKTKWFLSLVPKELNLSAESKVLNPADKDSVKQTVCFWLVELGELDATFKKSDVAALKAFLTRRTDMFRPPYAKHECNFVRRTVFFGSVNEKEFLVDKTGNRRFWTLQIEHVNFEHGLNMQQIWAEVLSDYKKGADYWLNDSEMAWVNEENKQFEATNPIEEKLLALFDWSRHGKDMTASELAARIGILNPETKDLRDVGTYARKCSGGKEGRKSNGKKLLWVGAERRK